LDEPGVAIHGQGFAQRDVIDDLSANYPEAVRGVLNIGLLHTSCGVYEGHDRYAPSSIAGLTTKEYDYWALGHIHKRENLAGPSPWIVYPGNPQGRHIREDGARGCVIVTIEHDRISKIDWHAIDVLRWQTCRVDAAACDEPDAILNDVELETEGMLSDSQGRPLAVRIEITGSTLAHSDLVRHATHWDRRIRETMLSRFDESVWVEKIKFRTQPANSRPVWERGDDPLGQLLESIADIDSVHSALAEIRDEYEQLLKYLPTDPRLTDLAPRIDEEHWERIGQEIVPEIKELLLARLLESSESV
jgi:DNA repair exonuclease SbcCD nuclease subunit